MPDKKRPNRSYRSLLFWIGLGIILIILYSLLQSSATVKKEVVFSDFIIDVEGDKVAEVTISGNQVRGKYVDGTAFKTITPPQYDDLTNIGNSFLALPQIPHHF
jgi:cell division protease FtsH